MEQISSMSCRQEHEEQLSSHEDPTEGENYRRLTYQSLKLQQCLGPEPAVSAVGTAFWVKPTPRDPSAQEHERPRCVRSADESVAECRFRWWIVMFRRPGRVLGCVSC